MAFCWNPKAIYIYESFWSFLQKFAYWNPCLASEIVFYFKKNNSSKKVGWPTEILRGLWFDQEKLIETLNIPREFFDYAFLDCLFFQDEIKHLSCHTLRFCPVCITRGFHSVIHQMNIWDKCPIHKKPLLNHCPYCHNKISIKFSSKNFKKPYSCQTCHRRLFRPDSRNVWVPDSEFWKVFHSIFAILKYRKKQSPVKFDLSVWRSTREGGGCSEKFVTKLFPFWSFMYSTKKLQTNYSMEFRIHESYTNPKNHDFNDLISVYKSFRRRLEIYLQKKHKLCFNQMKLNEWTIIRSGILRQNRICPYLQAYLYWRMYWENCDSALYDFQKPFLKEKFLYLSIRTYPYSCSNWLGKHIFWKELEGTYAEALQISLESEEGNIINRLPVTLYLKNVPYWESFRSQERGAHIFGHFAIKDS